MQLDLAPLIDRLRAAGEPTRLRILALLRERDLSVGELVQVLAQSQPRLSHHLKVLTGAGLVERMPEGSFVFYRAATRGDGRAFLDALFAQVPQDVATLKRDADQLDEDGRNLLGRVRAAAQRMATLIDDLLNLSRISRSEMKWENIDLTELVHSIIDDLRPSDPTREVAIVIATDMCVSGDERLIRIALENLLRNAWKFTRKTKDARIEVVPMLEYGPDVYAVRDNGAGFDMAYADKLFGAFQRLHSVSEYEGTGIGLATVQRIIHRHGGRIWAEGAVNEGATFYFTLQVPQLERRDTADDHDLTR